MAMETRAGIWTEHEDPTTGRKFYFNMVHNRSYWTLPDELQTQVHTPMIETMRQWEPTLLEKQAVEQEQQRKKREEAVAKALASAKVPAPRGGEHVAGLSMEALQERMALAAQKKKEEEMQRTLQEAGKASNVPDQTTEDNEYLRMRRELQNVDRDTEGTGSKWLVR